MPQITLIAANNNQPRRLTLYSLRARQGLHGVCTGCARRGSVCRPLRPAAS